MSDDIPIPGTVQLVDTQHVLHVEHGKNAQDIVLIPQPSDDPDDPLRWSPPRKTTTVVCAMGWCFISAFTCAGLSPAYVLIERDTGISIGDLSTGNGLMFLFLGWGTLITQCIALNYGRRPTLIVSMLGTALANLWTAYISSRGEFFANRIILGTLASPVETLLEVIIADIHFTHDRGFYMSVYSWTLWCGAFLGPVTSGYIAQEYGWRWIQYTMSILGAVMTILTFFLFEETMYFRYGNTCNLPAISGLPDKEAAPGSGPLEVNAKPDYTEDLKDASMQNRGDSSSMPQETPATSSIPESTKTYAQKLKVWGFRDPRQPNTFKFFLLPFQLLRYSGISFAGLLVGGILSWYNVVGGSLALILSNEPYNFSANNIGLTYLSCVVGVTIGCFLSGSITDILAVRLSRKNNGIMEPEYRLWMCILALVAHPAGCLLYGVGAFYQIHWIGVVIGIGLISVTLPMGSNLGFVYILDTYKEVGGEGVVSTILVRNLMGFAFGYAVIPMIENLGLRNTFVLLAVLGTALWCTCIFMIFYGKPLRRSSAVSYWKLVGRYEG
ncbi:major facilitator superfamily domain-containing protein [Ilyonectria sp. MPI-CAGE-AT-0026]|nr:major facilitator superfamily domain-containing protein [Ilyonectria sp. MPI-CAGE-AT-0026]